MVSSNDDLQSRSFDLLHSYNKFVESGDPRVKNLLFMQSPVPIAVICLSYVYFVIYLGPNLMRNRKPFNLRPILVAYNAMQTIFSCWLFYLGSKHWIDHYNWGLSCLTVNSTDFTEVSLWALKLCYFYFLSKISELADTIFFVLKKKTSHITVLHVFHHAMMPFMVWFGVKFSPGGNLTFFGVINLFVHIWMYLYYMLAAMGPQYQKLVWWKRHITEMQLAQFGLIMLYMLYISHKCNFNQYLVNAIFFMDIIFIVLFANFYIKAYRKRKDNQNNKAMGLKEN